MTLQRKDNRAEERGGSILPRGCWIALIVGVVLVVLFMVVLGIGVWLIAQNPEVQRVGRAVRSSVAIATEAQNAPGAREVRALGCDQALVMGMEEFDRLAREIEGDGAAPPEEINAKVVLCQFFREGQPPSCDLVAQTYAAAVPDETDQLYVMVQRLGNRNLCEAHYDPSGRRRSSATRPSGSSDLPLAPNPFE